MDWVIQMTRYLIDQSVAKDYKIEEMSFHITIYNSVQFRTQIANKILNQNISRVIIEIFSEHM